MEQPKNNTALWWSHCIRDPIIRKQAVDNVKVQKKEDQVCTGPRISSLFTWIYSPEGQEYWSKLDSQYSDVTLWNDTPIMDDEWQIGEELKEDWLRQQPIYEWVSGSWKLWKESYRSFNRDRKIEEVKGGYGKISEASNCWLGPKVQKTRTKLSFSTEDGYDLYDQHEGITWVQKNADGSGYYIGMDCPVVELHKEQIEREGMKLFSVSMAAEVWIKKQNQKIEDAKKPVYQVDQWITVITPGETLGKTAQIVYIRADGWVALKEIWLLGEKGKYNHHGPNAIRPATAEEIKAQQPVVKWKTGMQVRSKEPIVYTIYAISSGKVSIKWVSPHDQQEKVRDNAYTIEEATELVKKGNWTIVEEPTIQPIGWKPGDSWRQSDGGKSGKCIGEILLGEVSIEWVDGEINKRTVQDINKYVQNGYWIINSSEKKELWSVGDRIKRVNYPGSTIAIGDKGTITDIDWEEKMLSIDWDNGNKCRNHMKYAEKITEAEPWSIVCIDGVRVYEGNKIWWLSADGKMHLSRKEGSSSLTQKLIQDNLDSRYLPFSTYTAAEQYRQKQCEPQYPQYKVGQRVLVHRGANQSGYKERKGEVIIVDKDYSIQPCISVKFDDDICIWCYPEDSRTFNVEILQDEVPDRKWRIGSKLVNNDLDTGVVYTIEKGIYKPYKVTWIKNGQYGEMDNYTAEEIDIYVKEGTWIPYNPEPILVTQENAKVGMKVVRGKDWDTMNSKDVLDAQDSNGTAVGTIIDVNVYKPGMVTVNWSNGRIDIVYRIGAEGRYDLYIAKEETNQITNNQNTKTNENEKSNNNINKDNYSGSICKEYIKETTITGSYSKGKAISVSQYAESVCRGQRSNGTPVRC